MSLLFDDVFEVNEVDPDGKKFTQVSRVCCRSQLYEVDLVLDVNSELCKLNAKDTFKMVLASTLSLDGVVSNAGYDQSGAKTLADDYEYAMFGRIFKFVDDASGAMRVAVHASFGGLIMQLVGEPKHLSELKVDNNVFLLLQTIS